LATLAEAKSLRRIAASGNRAGDRAVMFYFLFDVDRIVSLHKFDS
jgi:hypothetical protein